MNKLTAEKCRHHIYRLSDGGEQRCLSIYEEDYLQALEIALPVLEHQESKDVFIVVRKPSHLPYIKRPVGDVADYLLQIYQHNPEVSCDVVTYRFPGASGQWVQDGKELLAELETPQPSTPQIDNDGWIDWCGGETPNTHAFLELRFKGGGTGTGFASHFGWGHSGLPRDIIAYRVIENDGREG